MIGAAFVTDRVSRRRCRRVDMKPELARKARVLCAGPDIDALGRIESMPAGELQLATVSGSNP